MSLVAESSTTFEACFLLKNDGRGRALGDGDIENADPAYTSGRSTEDDDAGGERVATDLSSPIRICFGTIRGSGPNLSVPQTTRSSLAFFAGRGLR